MKDYRQGTRTYTSRTRVKGDLDFLRGSKVEMPSRANAFYMAFQMLTADGPSGSRSATQPAAPYKQSKSTLEAWQQHWGAPRMVGYSDVYWILPNC